MNDDQTPIERCVERWHAYVISASPDKLDELIHPDCVFYSPVVHTPQHGGAITKAYLDAAGAVLLGTSNPAGRVDNTPPPAFRYAAEILHGYRASLQFETLIFDPERDRMTAVNGVDLITCDDDAMIVEFKVMIRPLQALNLVHAKMAAQLGANP